MFALIKVSYGLIKAAVFGSALKSGKQQVLQITCGSFIQVSNGHQHMQNKDIKSVTQAASFFHLLFSSFIFIFFTQRVLLQWDQNNIY